MIFVLILLCVCVCYFNNLVFASIFVDDHSAVEACVSNLCEDFFGKNDTVYVIIEDDYTSFKINLTNPVVMVNVNKHFEPLSNEYLGHYMFYTKDALSLNRTISKLTTVYYGSKPWLIPVIARNSLVITKSKNISQIFKVLWKRQLFNTAVLEYDDVLDTQNATVYQSHPYFDHENECGAYVEALNPQKCNTIMTVRKHSKTITNYPKCIHATYSGRFLNEHRLKKLFLNTYIPFINEALNVRLKTCDDIPKTNSNEIVLWGFFSIHGEEIFGIERGEIVYSMYYAFIVPTPPIMSPLETIFIIFHTEVWIMVAFGLFFVWLSWSLLAKYLKLNYTFERYTRILMHVLSIALWGSTTLLPMHRALRCLVVCFIFYSVVMQTAFSANLLHFMVQPQYEPGINSLKDLAESKLDIFGVRGRNFLRHFYNDTSNDDLVSKLHEKLIIIDKEQRIKIMTDIVTYKNCAYFGNSLEMNKGFQKDIHYKIISDARYMRRMDMSLAVLPQFFFLKSTDVIIRRIKESGINDKIFNDFNEEHHPKEHRDDDTKVPLSLEHLLCAFTILGIGQLIAFLVFLGEILYWKSEKNSKITPTSACTHISA